jgi:carboxypeptidase Q
MLRRIARSLIVTIAAGASVSAQEPVDRGIVAKIRDEGLQRSHIVETFTHFTVNIGPRLTASPAYDAALRYARERLASWGLSHVRTEPFTFGRGWSLERFSLEIVEPRYFPLIGFPAAWSPSTHGRITGAPVWLESADAVSKHAGRVGGAIVLSRPLQTGFERVDRPQPTSEPVGTPPPKMSAPPPSPQSLTREQAQAMTEFLQRERPGVVLQPSAGEHGTVFVTGRDQGPNAVPTVVVAAEHYNMIVRMIEQGLPVRVAVDVQARFHENNGTSESLIAEIPGTDPKIGDEVVMVGAHLDSWHSAVGATDNADGSSIAMEAVRILLAIGAKPRRTIRVALWGGEEQGLHGSRAWVERHLAGDANTSARDRFSVYFNLDNGIAPVSGFFLEGNAAMRPIMQAWLEPFRDLVTPVITLQSIGATDHLPFIAQGVPGFQAVQDFRGYDTRTHHTNMDTVERIDPGALKRSAVIVASILYHAAMRDQKIPRAGS